MADPHRLEPVAARAWPAREAGEIGGWRLYASDGYSGRINACWPLAEPGRPVADAIADTEAWYAARGLPPVFKIVEAACAPADLTARLGALGYRPHTETLMMTGPLAGEPDPAVTVSPDLDAAFEQVFVAAGSGDPRDARERLDALARIVPPRAFARYDVTGAPAAIGAVAVEAEWAGVFAMRTAPEHRRRGLARKVFETLLATARAAGARRGYLQVEAENAAAIALYAAAGYVEAYRYRYWSRNGG